MGRFGIVVTTSRERQSRGSATANLKTQQRTVLISTALSIVILMKLVSSGVLFSEFMLSQAANQSNPAVFFRHTFDCTQNPEATETQNSAQVAVERQPGPPHAPPRTHEPQPDSIHVRRTNGTREAELSQHFYLMLIEFGIVLPPIQAIPIL
jgi:hypothetical protein